LAQVAEQVAHVLVEVLAAPAGHPHDPLVKVNDPKQAEQVYTPLADVQAAQPPADNVASAQVEVAVPDDEATQEVPSALQTYPVAHVLPQAVQAPD